jgi:hypothetical protein
MRRTDEYLNPDVVSLRAMITLHTSSAMADDAAKSRQKASARFGRVWFFVLSP